MLSQLFVVSGILIGGTRAPWAPPGYAYGGHSQLSQNVDSSLIYEESKVRRPSGYHLPLGLKSRVHYRVGDNKLNETKNDNSQLLCFKLKIKGSVW